MENLAGSKQLREIIRLLERKLGLFDELQASCCGVTFAQCHTIVEIGRAGQLSLNTLADELELDKSTMSRTINNLVTSDLVIREIDPEDRRYVAIRLTEKGRGIFLDIEERMDRFFRLIYDSIPETKREQVLESMEIFLKALEGSGCC